MSLKVRHGGVDVLADPGAYCYHGEPAWRSHFREQPPGLQWSLHRGETDPILGWCSPGLGQRVPAFTLLGCGRGTPGVAFTTRPRSFRDDTGKTEKRIDTGSAVSQRPARSPVKEIPKTRAEAG